MVSDFRTFYSSPQPFLRKTRRREILSINRVTLVSNDPLKSEDLPCRVLLSNLQMQNISGLIYKPKEQKLLQAQKQGAADLGWSLAPSHPRLCQLASNPPQPEGGNKIRTQLTLRGLSWPVNLGFNSPCLSKSAPGTRLSTMQG